MIRSIFLLMFAVMLGVCTPAMAQYDVKTMIAESAKLPDLTFPSEAKELWAFSNIYNGLFKPAGGAQELRYPVLVLLHTCGGIRQRESRYWIEAALDKGYVVLVVDGMRGNKTNCTPPTPVQTGRRIKDAFDALRHLSGLPFVDPARIFVAGFSQGAFTASFVSSAEVAMAFMGSNASRFSAAASFYGLCQYPAGSIPRINYPVEIVRQDVDRPLLILMGQLDNETPAAWCDSILPPLKSKGAPVEWHVYPETTHCWDCFTINGQFKTDFKGDQITYRFDKTVTEDSRRRMFDFFSR